LKVIGRSGSFTVEVTADAKGLSSRGGTAMLPLLAEQIGLTRALVEAFAHTRERRCAHSPGRVFSDLAVMLCDGGRCVSDLGALGDQGALFGDVASVSTARRVLLETGARELDAIGQARAQARAAAWAAGAAPARVILDFDATLVTAHSDKQHAAGNYKGGFGFHPLLATCGREALAGILRPGNAGANTAADHIDVLELALEALPRPALDGEILARADGAGASHAFAQACRETDVRFSLGFAIYHGVREAILALGKRAWKPALDQGGQRRKGAWVAELTANVDLSCWPAETRLICRGERPHPGAQLSFTDVDGHRFQCFLTDQPGSDIAMLEVCHRQHACVEDRIPISAAHRRLSGGDRMVRPRSARSRTSSELCRSSSQATTACSCSISSPTFRLKQTRSSSSSTTAIRWRVDSRGRKVPFSIREIALWEVPAARATSSWVSPSSKRRSRK